MSVHLDELSTMDAIAQAELVRRRELTPLELVDAAIARIERVNPTINAVITSLFEEARAAAVSPDLPDGPFRGVPFLLKDIVTMQKGQPYYAGNRALRGGVNHARQDEPAGIWHTNYHSTGRVRCNPQSLGSRSIDQRLLGRLVRGGGGRSSSNRACE